MRICTIGEGGCSSEAGSRVDGRLNSAAGFFVLVYTFINPYPHLFTIREVSYYLAVACCAVILFRNKDFSPFKTPLTLPVALFTLWAFVGLFFTLDRAGGIHDFRRHLLDYILLFVCYLTFLRDCGRVRLLLRVLVLSLALSSCYELYFWYGKLGNPWYSRILVPNYESPVGAVGFMALYALLAAFYLWMVEQGRRLWRSIVLACMLPLLLALYGTQMRSLLVAVPFVLFGIFWDHKKWLLLFLAVVLVPTGLLLKAERGHDLSHPDTPRLTLNYISMLVLKDHPLVGIGYGIDSFGKPEVVDPEYYRAQVPEKIRSSVETNIQHSLWLGIATRTGLPGLLLFCWIWGIWFWMNVQVIRRAVDEEVRMLGRLGIAILLLYSIYGLFNVVNVHFLEALLCLGFAVSTAAGRIVLSSDALALSRKE